MRSEFGTVRRRLFLAVLTPIVPAAIILAGLFTLRSAWPLHSWWQLAAEFAAAAGTYLLVAWWFVLGDGERTALRSVLARFRKPKPDGSSS
jgi:hypothetical protein